MNKKTFFSKYWFLIYFLIFIFYLMHAHLFYCLNKHQSIEISIRKEFYIYFSFNILISITIITLLVLFIKSIYSNINEINHYIEKAIDGDYIQNVSIKRGNPTKILYKNVITLAKHDLSLLAIVDHLPEMFIVIDDINIIKFTNRHFLSLVELEFEQVINYSINNFFLDDDLILEPDKTLYTKIRVSNNRVIPVKVEIKEITNKNSRVIGKLLIVDDKYETAIKEDIIKCKEVRNENILKLYSSQIEKMEKVINEVSKGNLSHRIIIKENDTFKELFTKINEMIEKLQYDFLKIYKANQELEDKNILLDKQNVKLLEMDKMKTAFLSTLSHELNTPLTYILSSVDIIPMYMNNTEKLNSILSQIKENTQQLIDINTTVIEYSKLSTGMLKFNFQLNNVNMIIMSLEYNFQKKLEKKNLKLNIQLENRLKSSEFDSEKLTNAFKQILSNSIKFSKNDSEIIIKTENIDNGVKAEFKDFGIGIKKEYIPILFDEFRQIEDFKKRKYEGLGIGLSYAKMIIEKHKGKIYIESEENIGTSVFIELPLKINS